jgi:hypothetical protein
MSYGIKDEKLDQKTEQGIRQGRKDYWRDENSTKFRKQISSSNLAFLQISNSASNYRPDQGTNNKGG